MFKARSAFLISNAKYQIERKFVPNLWHKINFTSSIVRGRIKQQLTTTTKCCVPSLKETTNILQEKIDFFTLFLTFESETKICI